MLLKGIPIPVHDLFKAACYKRGKSMKTVFVEMMRRYIKESEELNLKGQSQ